MVYRVLIVDDSSFFQTRLSEIINECPDLNVVGVASNGLEAIEKDKSLKPDIISMDYEMPQVDGITALKEILSHRSVPIVMLSSMTYEGARITLDALEAGAVDFLPKVFSEVSSSSKSLKKRLHEKLVFFASNGKGRSSSSSSTVTPLGQNTKRKSVSQERQAAPSTSANRVPARSSSLGQQSPKLASKLRQNKIKLVVIGSSTGGPVALSNIISRLPADFPAAIVVIQHMPENFTKAFAERLNRQSQLSVKEAESGDKLLPGSVLVAPGGKHLMFEKNKSGIKIVTGDERVNYKPSVDISFASAANVFGAETHAIILTGMGADGCEGARLLKEKGASVWAQDEESSVVYGMPAAVAKAGLVDAVLPLEEFHRCLTT